MTVAPSGEAPSRGSAVWLEGVGVRYGDAWALRDVDLEVGVGQRVALVGPSGAGKSTLLSLLNGTVLPTLGTVRVLGQDPTALAGRQQRRFQRRIGSIHQQLQLVGPLRVVHNVNAGRLGEWSLARAALSLVAPRDVGAARAALDRVGIPDKLYQRLDRLSGGEQQRVALARVLVQSPEIILGDEPIASLDPARGREMLDLLRGLAVESGTTLVVSLHAFELALSHFERVVGLRHGRVLFDCRPADVTPAAARGLYELH